MAATGSVEAGRAAEPAPLEAYDAQTVSAAVYDWTGLDAAAHDGRDRIATIPANAGDRPGGARPGAAFASPPRATGRDEDIVTGSIDRPDSPKALGWLGSPQTRASLPLNRYFIHGIGSFGFGRLAAPVSSADLGRWNRDWTQGVGAELVLARDWTPRLEAFRYDLGHIGFDGLLSPIAPGGVMARGGDPGEF